MQTAITPQVHGTVLANTFLTGSCWVVLAGAARCPAVRQGMARPAVLDVAAFPGAAAQSRRRKRLVPPQDVPGAKLCMQACTHYTHGHVCTYRPPYQMACCVTHMQTCRLLWHCYPDCHQACGVTSQTRRVEAFLAEGAACANPRSGTWARDPRGASSTNNVETGGPDSPETSKFFL